MNRFAFWNCLKPTDTREIYNWAAEFVEMPNCLTVSGKFQPNISRHLLAPLEALKNGLVRVVVLLKPTRGAGTLISDVALPWIIANDPGPCLVVMQTDVIARDHAEARIQPILSNCAPVAALFPENRHKRRSREVIFKNGMPLYVRGPSIGNLQSKGIRWAVADEVWIWQSGKLAELEARLGDFEQIRASKLYVVSQGGVKNDDLHSKFDQGDCAEWNVPCLKCGHYQVPAWQGVRPDGSRYGLMWDENDNTRAAHGEWKISEAINTIRYECVKCGHKHPNTDKTRQEWNKLGKYISTKEAPRHIRSFHYNSLIIRDWGKVWEKWIAAREALEHGNTDPLKAFVQKELAEPWDDMRAFRSSEECLAAYEVSTDPKSWPDEKYRFMTVDCQDESIFWAVIRAWGPNESRLIWFGKLFSFTEINAKAVEFGVRPGFTYIDSGFRTKDVYHYCTVYRWVALKGDDVEYFIHPIKDANGRRVGSQHRSYSQLSYGDPEKGTINQGRARAPLLIWSNPLIKERLDRMKRGKSRGMKWLISDKCQITNAKMKDYHEQIGAEICSREKDRFGHWQRVWKAIGPNHLWDCECEQVLAATLAGCLSDMEE